MIYLVTSIHKMENLPNCFIRYEGCVRFVHARSHHLLAIEKYDSNPGVVNLDVTIPHADGGDFVATIYKKDNNYFYKNESGGIARIYTRIPDEIRAKAGVLANKLSNLIDTQFTYQYLYRNTVPSMKNLLNCLKTIERDASILGSIKSVCSGGQGGHEQPDSILQTLQLALKDVHGGVHQSHIAMKADPKYSEFVLVLDDIVKLIKVLVIY